MLIVSLILSFMDLTINLVEFGDRPRCRSGSFIAEDADGDESIRMRDLQQGVSERSESSASQKRAQSAMEIEAKS